ncbi:peptidoglycan DD-metalloendopeptidase family protein [Parabacteroides sp. PF5-9]|uniref:peptidoglycan DD-metalloendopeptidase family protein n=1 Tax=Parabacteroides sp. PF5-9 TaxID=1742404 RepID=UPI0024757CCE|nr:peptidoglycan DD-metalloendopeptidase family protein [Parabacteroides sp. PF5-9]MDH6356746.1 murein DD-endopeptidase MepM/ murein hydrolase activator NlpD [Parabacteroides sp. PF5-9]
MNIKKLLVLACTVCLTVAVSAQENKTKESTDITPQTQLMDERVSELMADRVGIKKDIAIKELIQLDEEADLLSHESLMFPADELYNSHWENQYVNPFRNGGVEFPDSCEIDCSTFILPIDSEIKVTSKYGIRRRRMHRGIDLKVQIGDTIRAAFDGKVRIRSYERRGYGYYLVVRHPNGLETIYGHLSKFLVETNAIVRAGEPIALGGNTGRSTGSHLHFETRFLGQDINPAELIDFVNGVPHQDSYVFRNIKINGKKSNIYTSGMNQMVYHRVKSGDNLGKIARMYGTTVGELCRLNGIKSTAVLRIGQAIRCSAGMEVEPQKATTKQETPSTATVKTTTVAARAEAVASVSEKTNQTQVNNDPVYHRIKSGDTLGGIARRYGVSVSKLCELNGITKTTILRIGRSIRCS